MCMYNIVSVPRVCMRACVRVHLLLSLVGMRTPLH